MYVIITCKYEKDPIKNSREKVETLFFPLKAMGIFLDIQGQLTPKSVFSIITIWELSVVMETRFLIRSGP